MFKRYQNKNIYKCIMFPSLFQDNTLKNLFGKYTNILNEISVDCLDIYYSIKELKNLKLALNILNLIKKMILFGKF